LSADAATAYLIFAWRAIIYAERLFLTPAMLMMFRQRCLRIDSLCCRDAASACFRRCSLLTLLPLFDVSAAAAVYALRLIYFDAAERPPR